MAESYKSLLSKRLHDSDSDNEYSKASKVSIEDSQDYEVFATQTIPDQANLRVCYAYASTNIFSKLIKLTIRRYFYSLKEGNNELGASCASNICDSYYDVSKMDSVTEIRGLCDTHSWNSLCLYIYIYKLITKKYGYDGAPLIDVLTWIKTDLIEKGELFQEDIFETDQPWSTMDISLKVLIKELCAAFLDQIEKRHIKFVVEQTILKYFKDLEDPRIREIFLNRLQILRDGYYIGMVVDFEGGSTHAMTLIDYSIDGDKIFFKVKNSWGRISTNIGCLNQTEGIITASLEDFLKENLYELDTLRLATPKEKVEIEKREGTGYVSEESGYSSNEDSEFGGGSKKTYSCIKVNKRISCKKRKTKNIKRKNTRNTRNTRNTKKTRKIIRKIYN